MSERGRHTAYDLLKAIIDEYPNRISTTEVSQFKHGELAGQQRIISTLANILVEDETLTREERISLIGY